MLELYTKLVSYIAAKKDEKGASAVEYALLVSLIAVAIVAAVTALGGKLSSTFNSISTSIS